VVFGRVGWDCEVVRVFAVVEVVEVFGSFWRDLGEFGVWRLWRECVVLVVFGGVGWLKIFNFSNRKFNVFFTLKRTLQDAL